MPRFLFADETRIDKMLEHVRGCETEKLTGESETMRTAVSATRRAN
jgi:hypothetical protein